MVTKSWNIQKNLSIFVQGGLKAVVWTDTLQSFSMIVGMLLVAIVGTIEVGGVGVVVQRASESGRFEFFK